MERKVFDMVVSGYLQKQQSASAMNVPLKLSKKYKDFNMPAYAAGVFVSSGPSLSEVRTKGLQGLVTRAFSNPADGFGRVTKVVIDGETGELTFSSRLLDSKYHH